VPRLVLQGHVHVMRAIALLCDTFDRHPINTWLKNLWNTVTECHLFS